MFKSSVFTDVLLYKFFLFKNDYWQKYLVNVATDTTPHLDMFTLHSSLLTFLLLLLKRLGLKNSSLICNKIIRMETTL